MAKTLSDKTESEADSAIDKSGVLIHTVEPSRDSKGSWSEIYQVGNDFYNRVYSDTQDAWMVFIEQLDNKEEILKYDPEFDLDSLS